MSQSRMTFVEHLADLRRRLLYVLAVFAVLLVASLVCVNRVYAYLTLPLRREGYKLVVISPGEIVMVYLSIAGVVAIGLTLPFALYQLWRFVEPGLTPSERRYTLRLLPVTVVMFITGVCFAWFVVFPMILHFLIHLASGQVGIFFHVASYFSFLSGVCVPFGFVFELPIVVVLLTRLGLVSPEWLRKVRKYAYLAIVVVGVFISPPELISHLSVITPMMFLYEVSIWLSAAARRRAVAQAKAQEQMS
ncbi:MAG: twin-arginine translocase subunit TatC [Alicyclobacillaceae bacterium]|nr:twin-arginine translocase subunit TatC [Alicyclobacillaceae bacterium]